MKPKSFLRIRIIRVRLRQKFVQVLLVSEMALLTIIICTFWYEWEKLMRTERIFRGIGRDRNTSAQVLPSVDTTIISPRHGCQVSGRTILATIMVPSLPSSVKERERIRNTWGKNLSMFQMNLFFFVGSPGDFSAVKGEANIYGDIISDDMKEDYYALTIKTLRMLKWFAKNCPQSQFLVKTDEDVVLNLPELALKLVAWPDGSHLGGFIIRHREPNLWNPFSKWYIPPELWSGGRDASEYLRGPCYVIQGSAVKPLLEESYTTPLYHLEDVYLTGILTQRLKFKLVQFEGNIQPYYLHWWYLFWRIFGSCTFTSIHTDKNFGLFEKIFEHCRDSL